MKTIEIVRMHPGAQMPKRMTSRSIGFDVYAAERVALFPGVPTLVNTGLSIKPEPGVYFTLHMRSGIAYKNGVSLVNDVGIIDPDYFGPDDIVQFAMIKHVNHKDIVDAIDLVMRTPRPVKFKPEDLFEPYIIEKGERIGQMIFHLDLEYEIHHMNMIHLVDVTQEGDTNRQIESRGGFGSTGTI